MGRVPFLIVLLVGLVIEESKRVKGLLKLVKEIKKALPVTNKFLFLLPAIKKAGLVLQKDRSRASKSGF